MALNLHDALERQSGGSLHDSNQGAGPGPGSQGVAARTSDRGKDLEKEGASAPAAAGHPCRRTTFADLIDADGEARVVGEAVRVSNGMETNLQSRLVTLKVRKDRMRSIDAAPQNRMGATGGVERSKRASQLVEDTINIEVLKQLKVAFEEADVDQGGSLDMEEFIKAFAGVLGISPEGPGRKRLEQMFMKIDANSDGTVDWNEFSTFMLLENQGSANMRETDQHPGLVEQDWFDHNAETSPHRDMITRIVRIPNDRYISSGRDGTVRLWSSRDLSHQRTVRVSKSWLSDAAYLQLHNRLAVSACNRTLSIFDVSTFEMVGQVPDLDDVVLTMDARVSEKRTEEMLAIGDEGGHVQLYSICNRDDDRSSMEKISIERVWKHHTHSDWVTKVKQIADLNCLASASMDKTITLVDFERRGEARSLVGHAKGIYSFDWSQSHKFIASCGMDRHILLWNPFSAKPLATLTGHSSSVQDIVVNDGTAQIITLGVDKTVKVWDIRTHKCLQTLLDKQRYRPENRVGSMLYDEDRAWLVTGVLKLKAWPLRTQESMLGTTLNPQPVAAALYNPHFHQVVSGDHGSVVCVWDAETGKMVFRFTRAHGSSRITAMAFDCYRRRLITGAHDGTVKVWNFSNGACLKELISRGGEEVTGLEYNQGGFHNKHILAVGWNRKVTFWEDVPAKKVEPARTMTGHTEDILSVALSPPSVLATSSYDGVIHIWNIDSGAIKLRLQAKGSELRPEEERAVERVVFFHTRRLALAACGADGYVRVWNAGDGAMALELHAGHPAGESLLAMCLGKSDTMWVTSDSRGFLKVWDASRFNNISLAPGEVASDVIVCKAFWRAHQGPVSTVEIIDAHSLILSASADGTVSLWGTKGQHVGIFGRDIWQVSDMSTWRNSDPAPCGTPQELMPSDPTCDAVPEEGEERASGREGQSWMSVEEKQSTPMQMWINKIQPPNRWLARSEYAQKVYLPKGQEKLNFPHSLGRPPTSIAHLLHIKDLKEIPKKPVRLCLPTPLIGKALWDVPRPQTAPTAVAKTPPAGGGGEVAGNLGAQRPHTSLGITNTTRRGAITAGYSLAALALDVPGPPTGNIGSRRGAASIHGSHKR